jgi:predicted KAP-like P-loop ATPase
MWSDNEIVTDLLGFRVHADLIKSVVTDSTVLPVVLGVFGEWGGGKSSIMRMLERDLKAETHEHTVCLYFNGWMFEGYEDAKTALLSSILVQLGEHKRFGPKVKERVVGLLKHVKLMEVAKLGVKHVGIPLAAAVLTGSIGLVPPTLAALIPWLPSGGAPTTAPPSPTDTTTDEAEKINWSELIQRDPSKPDLLEIRKFRDDFEKMLAETDIQSLVILIDDLDRCLPERIIETLEAIKLFVAVPKTAFIIGADPRIVRHAIATRYVAQQIGDATTRNEEEYDLVKDYLEKLIQIPYHLPRLSPAEIETYINLLACQKHLAPEKCGKVLKDWADKRKGNFYAAYQHGAIKAALQEEQLAEELARQLAWSNTVAPVITEGLKGNPRQIKRMFNALVLRKKLADIAHITIRDEVLAKLMVLEYTNLKLFGELNNWQVAENGSPDRLKRLERAAREEDDNGGRITG